MFKDYSPSLLLHQECHQHLCHQVLPSKHKTKSISKKANIRQALDGERRIKALQRRGSDTDGISMTRFPYCHHTNLKFGMTLTSIQHQILNNLMEKRPKLIQNGVYAKLFTLV